MSPSGHVVGHYEIGSLIGAGAAARVYVARDVQLGRIVAVKELRVFADASEGDVRRFNQEARIAARLSHPNIVVVHELFEHGGMPYIAMEHVPGGDLRRHLAGLSTAQVIAVLEGVLAGLAEAERDWIVHRDIKPANVLVTAAGNVKISDFGIAKAANATTLTRTGFAVGTPAYMAPEQATRGGEIGPYTDLYATGAMAFHMLTGRPPFLYDDPMRVLFAHLNEPLPAAQIDARLYAWLERMLAKAPADRFQRAAQAWAALEEIADALAGPRWRRAAGLDPGARVASTTGEFVDFVAPLDTGERIREAARRWAKPVAPAAPPPPRLETTQAPRSIPAGVPARPRGGRRSRGFGLAAVLLGALAAAIVAAVVLVPRSGHPDAGSSPPPKARAASSPPLLTARQLQPALVPKAAYRDLLPRYYETGLTDDPDAYGLLGGLASLKLCRRALPAHGLGADTSSSYVANPIGGVGPAVYFASDAGSFADAGASKLLEAAAAEGPRCGWRSLPGAKLDSQVVRLTADKVVTEGVRLHTDVVLVRERGSVVEVATATTRGAHSSDIERLADGAARRLAQAVRRARS